jgi:basic amino acid/polyamine antiporter, APA family
MPDEPTGPPAPGTPGPGDSTPGATAGSSAAAATTTPKLFVRQSSGLVRNVSVTNALFFNVAAFVGVGLTLYPIFYSLADVPVWRAGPFSAYGWAAIVAGLFCVLLALIFASLTSVMPRSGGDYVFTSRILHPFLGWLESWTLVIASVLIIAFEVPLVLRNLQITARIIGIGAGGHFFTHANTWFTDSTGTITGTPGFIGSIIVLLLIASVAVLPTRSFHRVVTALAGFGVACFAAMLIFGLAATHKSSFVANLPHYTGGVTAAHIAQTGKTAALIDTTHSSFLSNIFSTTVFPLMLSVLLFQFIGFQYSAYIAGEVRGNVRRGVLIALVGALAIGVLANSVYVDAISSHFGFNTNVSWGGSYWGFNTSLSAIPLGQPNSMPLLAAIANNGLWPLWALISLGGVVFPFLLCPVYINFISRMQLAWSLDRQMPEWFGAVNERLRAPLNAILATIGLTALFLFFQSYKALPTIFATTGHKLNLAGTAWFSIMMAVLTWSLPGINAGLVRWRRPDLVRNAPFGKALPWIGLAWLVFPLWIYIFAVIKPIVNALKGTSALTYLETNGILDAGLFYLIGIVIYFVMRYRAVRAGVDEKMLFTELPPD